MGPDCWITNYIYILWCAGINLTGDIRFKQQRLLLHFLPVENCACYAWRLCEKMFLSNLEIYNSEAKRWLTHYRKPESLLMLPETLPFSGGGSQIVNGCFKTWRTFSSCSISIGCITGIVNIVQRLLLVGEREETSSSDLGNSYRTKWKGARRGNIPRLLSLWLRPVPQHLPCDGCPAGTSGHFSAIYFWMQIARSGWNGWCHEHWRTATPEPSNPQHQAACLPATLFEEWRS